LLTPDSALLGGSENINVPLAGPVSFFGFMLLGPAVLIALRVYLQIYVEHSNRLDRLARSVSAVRAPTLVPLQNSLIRLFSAFTFYLLLPMAMLLFAWKAAVFPAWGLALSAVAVAVIVSHFMLLLSRVSWRSKALLSVSAAIIAGGVMLGFGWPLHRPFVLFGANFSGQWLVHRPFVLFRANLSGQWLARQDLRKAYLDSANLRGADLTQANLSEADLGWADMSDANLLIANMSGAFLYVANLSRANLTDANLSGAYLSRANLSGANLTGAKLNSANLSEANLNGVKLTGANLSDANLSDAKELTQFELDKACGNSATKLPEGLTLLRILRPPDSFCSLH